VSRTDGPTHDWSRSVDREHLAAIRAAPERFAPGGVGHLLLEVLAYAAEEAESQGAGHCVVRLDADGSVLVADDGRGTQVRVEGDGVVRKPVMSTPDLRFFDRADPVLLPDGRPRRGISVVAALSGWLVHTNRRPEGAWEQRYEHGVPVTDLVPVPDDGSTGTAVHLLPDASLEPLPGAAAWSPFGELLHTWPALRVEITDLRPG
jgi:DNA gyrase subunit B